MEVSEKVVKLTVIISKLGVGDAIVLAKLMFGFHFGNPSTPVHVSFITESTSNGNSVFKTFVSTGERERFPVFLVVLLITRRTITTVA